MKLEDLYTNTPAKRMPGLAARGGAMQVHLSSSEIPARRLEFVAAYIAGPCLSRRSAETVFELKDALGFRVDAMAAASIESADSVAIEANDRDRRAQFLSLACAQGIEFRKARKHNSKNIGRMVNEVVL